MGAGALRGRRVYYAPRSPKAPSASASARLPYVRAALSDPVDAADHVRGATHAPLTLVEYGDYECTYCRSAGDQVDTLLHELGDDARFAFRHFPVALVHPHAHQAAEAAEAAAGQLRFWEMHGLMLNTHRVLDVQTLLALARDLDLDETQVQAELASHDHLRRVRRDISSGHRSGVSRTPSFFVNGLRFEREHDFATVDELMTAVRAACLS